MLNELLDEKSLFVTPNKIEKEHDYNTTILQGGFFGLSNNTTLPTTQKAKGIFFLQNKQETICNRFPGWRVPKHLLFAAGAEFDDCSFDYPVFARPCPTVPRHGFVDSVICRNGDELNAVSKQTFEVEPLAELLVTKPVDSSYNVIINGGVITFATGNDGATSGRGCNYFYISDDPIGKITHLDQNKIIAENEVPFYEFVLDAQEQSEPVRLVQVRSAPHTPRVKDFVPEPVQVVNILKAEGDLLEWESKLKNVDAKTTIIDHTNGSLSSHYAIHAIVNRIPIFTSYCPEVGSLIEPTVEDTEINSEDEEKFFQAFVLGFGSAPLIFKKLKINGDKNIHTKMNHILLLALATLHNFSGLALSKDYEILGLVLGMFCRTAFAVSAGEARHAAPIAHTKFPDFYKVLPFNQGRNPCYEFMMLADTQFCIDNANVILNIFSKIAWTSGYGGKKWARCTRSAINLFNACVNKEITKVVELFNQVINEEHNGGKYLNKVISVDQFDEAAKRPADFTLQHLHVIVDFLSTAWSLRSEKNDVSLFQEIKMETIFKKKLLDPEYFLKFSGNEGVGLFTAVTFLYNEVWHSIDLPVPVTVPADYNHNLFIPVKLVGTKPHWWYLSDETTKIISKAKLSKLVDNYLLTLAQKELLEAQKLEAEKAASQVVLKIVEDKYDPEDEEDSYDDNYDGDYDDYDDNYPDEIQEEPVDIKPSTTVKEETDKLKEFLNKFIELEKQNKPYTF